MEQRTGPITPPMPAAGTDPAYIPGLTPPPSGGAEEAAAEERAEEHAPEDAAAEAADAPVQLVEDAEEAEDAEDLAEPEGAPEDGGADGGPVFEAADRRSTIRADRAGVTLRLDGETAEFDWDEIGAVEIDTPRFGRRFSVTVYTTSRRWYQGDVDAPAKSALKEWTAQLDAVLDAYFEDGGQDEEPDGTDEAAGTDGTAEAAEGGDGDGPKGSKA
ncbi:hypothetical protein RKE29_00415 [Streptomyces sp. B1866]|uniref:hypothetical protein n=1 Tax=Streptomyces sp. B1866 TaxID=3075431 RepID=UPI002891C725|nr:hypothetical protein [Streptomyces sp. B1866]MDT3395134.1 hypothetical protein [Streptomyces sp. B1866]